MKRICILLFVMLGIIFSAQAQTTITVTGIVVCNGVPVQNAVGTITDSISGVTATVTTDSTGTYSFSYMTNSTQGSVTASFPTGAGNVVTATGFFNPMLAIVRLVPIDICSGGGGSNCQAAFRANPTVLNPLLYLFTDNSTGSPGNPVTSWSWDFGDGNSSTAQNPTHTYASNGTYTVCLVITAGTCSDSTCQTITIGTPPGCQAAFTYQQGAGSQVFFTNFSRGGTAPYTYSWSFGDGNSSTAANPTHTYNAPGPFTVCLTFTDASGCVDSTCQTVTLNSSPSCNAAFTFSVGALGVQFNDLSTGLAPAAMNSYSWDFGDGNTSTAQNPLHNYANSGTYTVCLVFTSSAGGMTCTDSTCSTITIQGSGNRATITGQVFKNMVGADSVKVWLIEHDPMAGTLTAIDSNYANYLPTYHDNDLMWNMATVITLTANAAATADINMVSGTNPGGPGFIGGLISQGANKRDPGDPLENVHVYLLDNNDDAVAYQMTDARGEYGFSNLAYGTYRVHVEILGKNYTDQYITISAASSAATNINFAVNSTEIDVTTSLEEATFGKVMKMYPNPTSGELYLELSLDKSVDLQIQVMDMLGRSQYVEQQQLLAGDQKLKLNLNNLSSGVYFLNLSVDNQIISQKVVVE
jgi:PKD repeat protein